MFNQLMVNTYYFITFLLGTSHWSDEANNIFQKLCSAKIIQAELIGTNKHDMLPAVELYVVDENKKVTYIFDL